jgi:MFS family permease
MFHLSKTGKNRIPRTVIMLGLVSLFTDAASEMIYPLVPVYVAALGSGAVVLGLIEGIAETTSSMLKLLSGIISDKIGKRKLLVFAGYAISSLVRPFTGLVTSAWQIILIRLTDRVGKGIRTAPRDALIAASVDESIRGKSFGFHRAMDHTGAVIGPALAIIVLLFIFLVAGVSDTLTALRWTFFFALIPGILALLTIGLFVKESAPVKSANPDFTFSLKNYDSNFRNYLLVMILFTLGNSSDAFLLYRLEEAVDSSGAVVNFVRQNSILNSLITKFGDSETQKNIINILFLPFVWGFFHIIKVVFSTPLGSLSDRIGRKKVISLGWGIYVFVYAGFALLVFLPARHQIIASFALFAIYALYYAFTEGAEKAFVADLVKSENKGTAYGLFNFAIGLGAMPASIIFGVLYNYSEKAIPGYGGTVAFSTGAAIALVSMILLLFSVKETR